jgi:hypothetical protein
VGFFQYPITISITITKIIIITKTIGGFFEDFRQGDGEY